MCVSIIKIKNRSREYVYSRDVLHFGPWYNKPKRCPDLNLARLNMTLWLNHVDLHEKAKSTSSSVYPGEPAALYQPKVSLRLARWPVRNF